MCLYYIYTSNMSVFKDHGITSRSFCTTHQELSILSMRGENREDLSIFQKENLASKIKNCSVPRGARKASPRSRIDATGTALAASRETARYLGMFYTSLGNNVLLPGWIISGMRRPSRQMARTGGNCGLLLALVSPVGCESRNAGDAEPASAATATLLVPSTPTPSSRGSHIHPTPPPTPHPYLRPPYPLLSTVRNYSRDSNAGMRISPL